MLERNLRIGKYWKIRENIWVFDTGITYWTKIVLERIRYKKRFVIYSSALITGHNRDGNEPSKGLVYSANWHRKGMAIFPIPKIGGDKQRTLTSPKNMVSYGGIAVISKGRELLVIYLAENHSSRYKHSVVLIFKRSLM